MAETIRCSECNKQLRVPEEMLGKRVKCPSCGTTFVASSPAEEPEVPVTEVTEEPLARRPREDLPEESEEESPRRRRRPRRDEEEEFEEKAPRRGRRASAASKVMGPAIGIMVVGGLSLLLALLGLVLNLTGSALLAGAGPGQAGNASPVAQAVGGILGAVIGICWGGVVLAGGLQMYQMKSYGLAMAGAIVGMVPCSACCLLGLPFGIWALVVLNDPDVKSAFG